MKKDGMEANLGRIIIYEVQMMRGEKSEAVLLILY